MNIEKIVSLLADICIHYYCSFHEKIRGETVNIPRNVHQDLMIKIYNLYCTYTDGYVYDMKIMDFPYDKQYILNEDDLDIDEIMRCVNDYIDIHSDHYDTTMTINVVSISNHPLENYICFNHNWIKWNIDLYRY